MTEELDFTIKNATAFEKDKVYLISVKSSDEVPIERIRAVMEQLKQLFEREHIKTIIITESKDFSVASHVISEEEYEKFLEDKGKTE